MQIRIKDDSVTIEGYVNAVERKSKPLHSRLGAFVERIKKGAFKRAIERNDDIKVLLNHDWSKVLGGTGEGNLELREDNIGLHAKLKTDNPEIKEKAKRGDLVGWSFGFTDRDVDTHDEEGILTRDVKDMNLFEVSILDRTKKPAYEGTMVTVRSDDEIQYRGEPMLADVEVREDEPKTDDVPKQHENVEEKVVDYSKYESLIAEMKGEF